MFKRLSRLCGCVPPPARRTAQEPEVCGSSMSPVGACLLSSQPSSLGSSAISVPAASAGLQQRLEGLLRDAACSDGGRPDSLAVRGSVDLGWGL